METRARYILVGLFVLVVTVGSFAFVYWLQSAGKFGDRLGYRIRFEGTVSGLRPGSAVMFNGLRIGEVTALDLDRQNPRLILATIMVDRKAPILSDTDVGIEIQGLMGSPAIVLTGGSGNSAPVVAGSGDLPVLIAKPGAGQDMMHAAREALRRVNDILVDNSEPLHSAIAHINTFSAALARNSDRLDEIAEGLVRMTGGGKKTAPQTFDLTAPQSFPADVRIPSSQLVVLDPTTVIALDTQRIVVPSDTSGPAAVDAQWADSVPKLVQARIIQGFENAKYFKAVRSLEGIAADRQMLIDIRSFRASGSAGLVANVEIGAKIIGDGGRIVDARVFHHSAPIDRADAGAVAAALDAAFGKVATELISWALLVI